VGGGGSGKTPKLKTEKTSKRASAALEANWAAVSGASDGIGREFALQLARKGFNIFLIGRNREKLSKVQKEIGKLAKFLKGLKGCDAFYLIFV
jgi:hypothetical protein